MEQHIDEHWHLRKEIVIGTIITLFTIVVSVTLKFSSVENQVKLNWQAFEQHALAEDERLRDQKDGNALVLKEIRSIKADVMDIKLTLAAAHVGERP